jgi:WD40 repeat protein
VWDVATGDDLLRIKAHDGAEFLGLDFSRDGQMIVTAGEDGPARVWDAESGELLLSLEGHDGWATDAAFSPDSAFVATVGSDGQLLVWDVNTGEIVVFRTDAAGFGGLRFVTYSDDGTKIATYSDDDEFIRIWGATTGDNFLSMVDKGGTESIHFRPDGNAILTGNTDGTIAIWDAFGGGEIASLKAHPNFVRSAAFSPDGSYIVTASDDTTARVFDVETGEEEYTLLGHGNWLTSAIFSPDGRLIASTDRDGITKLWDTGASALIPELEHDDNPPIRLAAFTPDGQRLVTAADDAAVNVWDVESGDQLLSFVGFSLDASPFDGSGDLAIIPVANENGSVDLWDVNSGDLVANLDADYVWVGWADISGDGRVAVTVGCDELDPDEGICSASTARVWDTTSGQEMLAVPYDSIDDDEGEAFELSRDGSRLVVANCQEYDEDGWCLDNRLTTWDTATGEEISSWSIGFGRVIGVDYSPDRESVFTTTGDETRLWDVNSGELLLEAAGYYRTADSRGMCFVTLADDFTAMIWDKKTGVLLGKIVGHRDDINTIEFSPDGERLITSSWDGTARVWNAQTGVEILNLSGHEGQVWRAHFSPDGNSIVTASEDGTALIWPFAADKLLELSEPAVQRYSQSLTPQELARFGLAGN